MGFGVFAKTKILKGTLLCTYTGLIDVCERTSNSDDSLLEFGQFKHKKKPHDLILSCNNACNIGRFFNSTSCFDSPNKNLVLEKGAGRNNRIVMIMYTTKNIEKNDEICWYYGRDYWKNRNITPISDHEALDD